jgi:flagellar basal-body rod modification protein FlgD
MSTVNNTAASDVLGQYRLKNDVNESKENLGKNEFMELMIAQLKNQDPLKPQENGDFIAQLAQFSSLEEMQGLSGSVDSMVGEFRSTQALQASAMVGRSVLVPSDVGILDATGEMQGFVNVPASTSNLRVSIVNPAGERVRQLNLGAAQQGQAGFVWDGKNDAGAPASPGAYQIVAEGSYPEGNEQLGTLVSANVDSVSLGGKSGGVTLNLAGMGSIALSDVRQIN